MRRPLVFLHGWGYTPAIWQAPRAALHDHASEAPALDWSGGDLVALARRTGVQIAPGSILVGWSLGAMLALQIAALCPDRCGGLFLIGASPQFVSDSRWDKGLDASVVAAFRSGFAHAPELTLKRFLALQILHDPRRHQLRPALEAALAETTTAGLADGLAMLERSALLALAAPALPIRLLHGAHDALMPLAAAQTLAARLPGAQLDVIEGAGHCPLFAEPEALARRIREFADEC